LLAAIGPAYVWCAEYIGSGEVILATRTGAILGSGVLWAVVFGVFLKCWIGVSAARYTVCTGEGMMDLIGRMPGPRNWAVWLVLVAQFATATLAIGSLASAAGVFVNSLVPLTPYSGGWLVTIFALVVVWSGVFEQLKIVMSICVAVIVVGVTYVALAAFPGFGAVAAGLVPQLPSVPEWAVRLGDVEPNSWREILPLMGWAAGGFASQVWYTYWVLGAGYGMAATRSQGQAADTEGLARMERSVAERVKGWCRLVYADATLATVIGVVVTSSFLLAGAAILRPLEQAPGGAEVALTLSTLFSARWGLLGGKLFLISGAAALISTQVGQLAGWPRLLADACRIAIPAFGRRLSWKVQYRLFLVYFFAANMLIVYTLGLKPVFLVKLAAILDGLLLTPLQALWVGIGLYYVMPRLLSPEARQVLRPHWIFAVGLVIAFLFFGYFCVFQVPAALAG
jgi:Mn2+/Fe2+ NRAMP family transporter